MSASTIEQLELENERLRHLLAEMEETLRALRAGEVDAVMVGIDSAQVFTLDPAHKPYRLMVEQIPQAAASFTADGIILHGNPRFAHLLAQPLDRLVGKSIYEFLAAESRGPFESLLRDVQAAEVRAEVKLLRSDGTHVPAYLGINTMHEGPLGMCLVMTDLSEQRHYAELELTQAALREADRRKNEFVAILAHELRNPLGPIRNAARILKLKGVLAPEFRIPVEMIERQTEQLARLLDDLLDVSRITRGALELRREHVLLSTVVDDSVEACHEELRDRGVHLHLSLPAGPVVLTADRARLVQMLCNLITNAAKYTPPGGKIDISATARDAILSLSVRDNGLGIAPERLEDIFELFAQVDRSGERSGGLGIGLTLVRQIAVLHGGSVEARSGGIGKGSEFILSLPVVVAEPAAVAAAAEPSPEPVAAAVPQPAKIFRILVVDDNRDAAESLTVLLEIFGHDVRYALDGDAAIAVAEQYRPELILLDLGMPKVSGYEVARRIRELPWGREIYLVALSGWGQADERLRTQEAGFDAHYVKPIAPEELTRILDAIAARPRTALRLERGAPGSSATRPTP